MGSRANTRRVIEAGDRSEQTEYPEVHAEREALKPNLGDFLEKPSQWSVDV